MIQMMTLLALVLPFELAAKDYPAGYWERTYNLGETPIASYSVNVLVPDIAKATAEVDRRMTKAGASLTNMNSYDQTGKTIKNMNYSVEARSAEAIAKGLFDLGDLQGYSAQKNRGKEGEEIREKLAEMTAEQSSNAECLAKMSISANYLSTRLNHLRLALAAIESGGAKASLQISLTEAPKAKK